MLFGGVTGSRVKSDDVRHVPVIMYHSVCKTNVGEYVIHPDTLRADFEYLSKHGYTAVFLSDVINFCDGKADLPARPVVITLDDGFYNNLYYVLDIAKECNVKFTVGIVGAYTDKEEKEKKHSPVYSYLTRAHIKKLYDSGIVEIANHTYDMHHTRGERRGIRRKKGESDADYEKALTYDSEKCRALIKEACGSTANVYVYPFGFYSRGCADILTRLNYRAILTCKGGINVFKKGSTEGLDAVMRYNRPGNMSTSEFFRRVLPANR